MDGYLSPKVIDYDIPPLNSRHQANCGPVLQPRLEIDKQQQHYKSQSHPYYIKQEDKRERLEKNNELGASGYLNPITTTYTTQPSHPIPAQHKGHKTRFDSGVGDLEMQGIFDSGSSKQSTAYDYVGNINHYEEVPTLHRESHPPDLPLRSTELGERKVQGERSFDEGQSTPGSQMTQSSVLSDVTSASESENNYINSKGSKRLASLSYTLFSSGKSTKKIDALERQLHCQCLVIFILFIVTLGTSALGIYLMIIQSNSFVNNNELLMRIKKLEEENMRLYHSSSLSVCNYTTTLTNDSVVNLNQINVNQQQIKITYQNLTSQLSIYTDLLQQQMANISKMPGPPGVGNLSACMYQNETTTSTGSNLVSTKTNWSPPLADLADYVVMSAVCSIKGGKSYNLETNSHTSSMTQYRCECTGAQDGAGSRHCSLHTVMCPRYS